MGDYKIAIQPNNCAIDEPCAICGELYEPPLPIALFLAETWEVVCFKCGKEHAPDLIDLKEHYYIKLTHDARHYTEN